MTAEELRLILKQREGLKLDFKRSTSSSVPAAARLPPA